MLYGIKDSCNITVIRNSDHKQCLYANYSNKTDFNFDAEVVYALKKGVNSISWNKNRTGTLSQTMQVFDLQWLALLFGTSMADGTSSDRIAKRVAKTITSNIVEFTGTYVPGSMTVFQLDSDGVTMGTELTVTAETTVPSGKYKVSSVTTDGVTTNTLTFNSGLTGDVVIYYLEAATSENKKFTIDIDKFPSGYELYLDAAIKGNDGVEKFVQIHCPNVSPKSSASITFDSENVAELSIEWDVLGSTTGKMFEFTTL